MKPVCRDRDGKCRVKKVNPVPGRKSLTLDHMSRLTLPVPETLVVQVAACLVRALSKHRIRSLCPWC